MILHIALKDLKIVFKDRKALAIMLLMPAVIMFILGSALGPMFEDNFQISKFSIGVVNEDDGIMSQVLINQVLREELSDIFNDVFIIDAKKAGRLLENETFPAIIKIPKGFTRSIYDYNPINIEVKSKINTSIGAVVVKSICEQFARSISVSTAAARAAEDILHENQIPISKSFEAMSDSQAVMMELQQALKEGRIEFSKADQEKSKTVSGMQYYSVAMLVMFILFGVNIGAKNMVEERENKTLGRLMCTGVGKLKVILGKFTGLMFIGFMQSLILIVFTHFIYGVNWGRSIPGILLITICCVFAGSGLGMMIAAIAKNSKAAEGISQLFIQLFTVIGGGMIPLYVMPDSMKIISRGTLNWWAVNAYYDLMLGNSIVAVLPYCGILILMGLVYLSIGTLKFKT